MTAISSFAWLLQVTPKSNGGIEDSYIAGAATLLAAGVAAIVAVGLHAWNQRNGIKERKRLLCGKAVGDALAWMEIPYRIRRRLDDNPETVQELAQRIHDLQESLLLHESWLRVESPDVQQDYQALVSAIKESVREIIQESWKKPHLASPADMNIGDLGIDRAAVDKCLADFTQAIRKRFA